MTLTEAIRGHPKFAEYCSASCMLPLTVLNEIAEDIRLSHELPVGDRRRIKQAIRDAAKNGKVKSGKGRPRKTYEVACAHCGRNNTISIVRE